MKQASTSVLKFHRFAELFPMLSDEEMVGFAADIKKYGLLNPIIVDADTGEGIDGRNRYKGCGIAGVVPIFKTMSFSDDAARRAHICSHNFQRRHLSESVRGLIADKLTTLEHGENKSKKDTSMEVSQPDAAKALKVSVSSVQRASKIRAAVTKGEVPASLLDDIKEGRTTLRNAEKQVDAARGKSPKPKGKSSGKSSKSAAKKSADNGACNDACNYDWKNPKFEDFGDPSEMYKAQADNYRREATHLAEAYPLLAKGIDKTLLTKAEVNAADAVVNAWRKVVEKINKLAE